MEKTINSTVDNMKSTATGVRSQINDAKSSAVDYLKDNYASVRDTAEPYLEDAEALVKRHPFYALAGAIAVGAIFGAFFARPSR
jgi:ElaB/YqjD/DUF883 family membrane-anchored ribosome-binding protein